MKTTMNFRKAVLAVITVLAITNYAGAQQTKKEYQAEIDALKSEITKIAETNKTIAENLGTFDELDYVVFTNQEWARLHESHSEDIIVHWPDGSTTTGIDRHIEDLKAMFVYAPDTRIKEHPIRIGSGNITAVMGVMEGTFTNPMPIGEGQFIEPTGKAFKISMVTIGLWNDKGVMFEEYLFWDNLTFMKQIGLAK